MRKKRNKSCFTLLEVMIGISILLLVSGVIGIRIHTMIQKKHFTSHVERFESRLIACRLMAANMQSDWKGSLSREKKEWVFETWNVDETKLRGFTPLRLDFSQLIWEGKERNPLHFLFTSTGEVLVEGASEGSFQFQHLSFKKEVRLPDLFQLAESSDGKKTGPLHPADSL